MSETISPTQQDALPTVPQEKWLKDPRRVRFSYGAQKSTTPAMDVARKIKNALVGK